MSELWNGGFSLIEWLFYGLILLEVVTYKDWKQRINDIIEGKKALLLLPVALTILLVVNALAIQLADTYPILHWGWLGYNVVFGPSTPSTSVEPASTVTVTILSSLYLLFVLGIVGLASTIFNYYEEKVFRKRWWLVPTWALLHLIMGIPIYAVIPIFSTGILYKIIYDKYSLQHAYTLHLGTNLSLLCFIIVIYVGEFI